MRPRTSEQGNRSQNEMGGGGIELFKLIPIRRQLGNCSGFELNAGLYRYVWG